MAVLDCFAILLKISVFWFYSTTASASTPNIVIFFVDDVSLAPLPASWSCTPTYITLLSSIYLATHGFL